MAYELLISSVAFIETEEAYIFYEEQQSGLGERFLVSVEAAYLKLSEAPMNYGFIGEEKDLRDIRVKHFPFVVIFQIISNQVLVLRVFNTSRNPSSLKNL